MIRVPITNDPNQSFSVSIPLTGRNIVFDLLIRWNTVAEYWAIDIKNNSTNTGVIQGLPLIPANFPADNMLAPFAYLDIGGAYLVRTSEDGGLKPNVTGWANDWALLWGEVQPV